MDAPSSKRSRENLDDGTITHAEPWLDDGNIILQAGTTQFRVHASILSIHSPVFRDMFNLAQPDSAVDCSVVHLSDDAELLGIVLRWMYQLE